MPVTTENPAPYAPTNAITDLIDRYRNRGLSKPFTDDVLARAGITDSLIPRTMQALQTLDLVDEAGNPTETLESLRRVPEPEFKDSLAAWIRSAYADVLSYVDPNDEEGAIRDAFRRYNPVGQQSRMVTLFMGLSRAAGMRTDSQPESRARPNARKPTVGSPPATSRPKQPTDKVRQPVLAGAGLPAPLAGLLNTLPTDGTWTKDERDKFLKTFEAVLDYSIYVVSKPRRSDNEEGADDA